ncbi:extracellular solute-binding protein [Populibacterium corticicola]|uniref:Extracellular solute-binding protein n=1 Tax=Populibacterium corticicola TaxID=1812826 RepID=A0ABW5XDE8_9MICO
MKRVKGQIRPGTRASAIVLAAATMFAVVGCTPGGSQETVTEGSATSGTVNWWGWTPERGVGENYIKLFNEQYPDITVNYRQIAVQDYDSVLMPGLSSSVGPDVFNVAPGGGIGGVDRYASFTTDMTPQLESAFGSDWKAKIAQNGPVGLETGDGIMAGLPVGSTFAGSLWINQDMFDKYNLQVPATYDEWVTTCQTLKTSGETCLALGAGDSGANMDFVHAIADSIEPGLWTKAVAGEAPWTSPSIIKAGEIFKEMFTNGIIQEGAQGMQQYPDVNNRFMAGEAAMVLMGTWYMQYSTVPSMTAAVEASGSSTGELFPIVNIPLPAMGDPSNPAPLFGDVDYGLAVSTNAKNPQAATTFATWLATSDEAQQLVTDSLNNLPSLNELEPQWDQIELVDAQAQKDSLIELQQRAVGVVEPRLGDITAELGEAIKVAVNGVATGSVEPLDAFNALQASADALR